LLYICSPNEVLIFSGGQRASSGKNVGYRAIKGGRAVRIPLLEAVDRIDLTNMPIEVAVTGAYSRGGIPLNVHLSTSRCSPSFDRSCSTSCDSESANLSRSSLTSSGVRVASTPRRLPSRVADQQHGAKRQRGEIDRQTSVRRLFQAERRACLPGREASPGG
jgi:hypothetical protein